MRKMTLLALVVCCWNVLMAQEDTKAKTILEKVTETTQSYESIKASFTYIMENKEEGIHDENKGNILLKGKKYQLVLPLMGLEIYSDGVTIWTFMKDANEVSIAEFDDEMSEAMDPSKLFTIYQEGFTYQFVEEKISNGKSIYVIDLFPESDELEYKKMRIEIEKSRMLVCKAIMYGHEGSNYVVQVDELKTNVAAGDDAFLFNAEKHPGVDTIDLR